MGETRILQNSFYKANVTLKIPKANRNMAINIYTYQLNKRQNHFMAVETKKIIKSI